MRQSSSHGMVPIVAAISRTSIRSAPCSPMMTTSSPGDDVHLGHVNHHHVHAHGADDRHAPPTDQHVTAAAETGVEAIGVPGRDHCNLRGRAARKRIRS